MPADLAPRQLFEPYRQWLREFAAGLPSIAQLNHLLTSHHPGLRTASGLPVRFALLASRDEADAGYEARIHAHGTVETRPDNWHDLFNALVWLAFPQAKAAISQGHAQALTEQNDQRQRGPRRDALTQFDECGVAVVSSRPELLELLRSHAWREAFWQRRAELERHTRFVVFGHGTLDQLRAPFFGLCAKAVYFEAAPDWLEQPEASQMADLDRRLAEWLGQSLTQPKDLKPLPLLGIPGVTPENAFADYYDDTRQFRPMRRQADGR